MALQMDMLPREAVPWAPKKNPAKAVTPAIIGNENVFISWTAFVRHPAPTSNPRPPLPPNSVGTQEKRRKKDFLQTGTFFCFSLWSWHLWAITSKRQCLNRKRCVDTYQEVPWLFRAVIKTQKPCSCTQYCSVVLFFSQALFVSSSTNYIDYVDVLPIDCRR